MQKHSIETADGTQLHGESHLCSAPRAWAIVVHGMAEHCGRYHHVAAKLNNWGINAFLYDHRGHGKSPGMRGMVKSMDTLCQDLCEIAMEVKSQAGSLPVFVVAHSMGTAVTIKAALCQGLPVEGYIFSGAVVKIPENISPILQKIAPLVSALLPALPAGDAGGSKFLSSDPKVGEAFDADPLNYKGKVRARTGNEILKTSRWIQERLTEFDAPVLLLHGTEDKLGEVSGSQLFYEQASSSDKTFVPFSGMEHEVFNEVKKDEVFATMKKWLGQRISK